jgi:hypothetical protein
LWGGGGGGTSQQLYYQCLTGGDLEMKLSL